MRKYIFTREERRRLTTWLEEGAEDNETRKHFTQIRRNLNPIKREIELLSAVANKLQREGRLMGLVRLHKASTSTSPSDASESTQSRDAPTTSPASNPS